MTDLDYDKVIEVANALQAAESPADTIRGFYERTMVARRVVAALGDRLRIAQESPAPNCTRGGVFQRLRFRWWLDGVEQGLPGATFHQEPRGINDEGLTEPGGTYITVPHTMPNHSPVLKIELRNNGRLTTLVGRAVVQPDLDGTIIRFLHYYSVSVVSE